MNFRSIADLNEAIVAGLCHLPPDIDVVVGVPRSGMLPATILALHMNLPLTDVDGYLEGRLYRAGLRGTGKCGPEVLAAARRVLVLDDSVSSGAQLAKVRAQLRDTGSHEILYGAVYVAPAARKLVDLYFEVLPMPRVFEWNIMHHEVLATSCVDIDGILCKDPTEAQNDDGAAYAEFLKSAPPFFRCTGPIGWLVTSRLEKYRHATEEWLERQEVRYRELVMLDLPDKKTRQALQAHGSFKGKIYRSTPAELFIESCADQAEEIAETSGKPVLCLPERRMIYPSLRASAPVIARHLPRSVAFRLQTVAWKLIGEYGRASQRAQEKTE